MPVDRREPGKNSWAKACVSSLPGGGVEEIELLELTICEPPEPSCGITYTLLSTHGTGASKEQGGTYWTAFGEIENFRVLGD